jgi:ubiquinol-cytochrome c reductase cytochrome b subunit
MQEDAQDAEFQAKLAFAERDAHRVVELAQREGIPPLGARELLANDPYAQGPRLFARHCSGCHRYDGHDGMFVKRTKTVEENGRRTTVEEPATAADLGRFGSRDWMKSVLVDYHAVFAPLESELAVASYGEKGKRFLTGDMASWCKSNKERLADAANGESLQALVEFVVAQSGRPDLGAVDEKLAAQGREIFKTGSLASGSLDIACADCHFLKPIDGSEELGSKGTGAPILSGYGGKGWLTAFLKNPGHEDFYGENNIMPAFESTLTDMELKLLVDWMTGDYYRRSKDGEQH